MVDAITKFFENCELTPEDPNNDFFFLEFLEEILPKLILTRESGIIPQKRLAYCGYKCHLLCRSEDMGVFEFKVTSANITLFLSVSSTNVVKLIKEMYGNDAYNAEQNHKLLMEYDIMPLFHIKEEAVKNPQIKRSAKKESKKRSNIEDLYGFSQENLDFGKVRVHGLSKVSIDILLFLQGGILEIYTHISLINLMIE